MLDDYRFQAGKVNMFCISRCVCEHGPWATSYVALWLHRLKTNKTLVMWHLSLYTSLTQSSRLKLWQVLSKVSFCLFTFLSHLSFQLCDLWWVKLCSSPWQRFPGMTLISIACIFMSCGWRLRKRRWRDEGIQTQPHTTPCQVSLSQTSHNSGCQTSWQVQDACRGSILLFVCFRRNPRGSDMKSSKNKGLKEKRSLLLKPQLTWSQKPEDDVWFLFIYTRVIKDY